MQPASVPHIIIPAKASFQNIRLKAGFKHVPRLKITLRHCCSIPQFVAP